MDDVFQREISFLTKVFDGATETWGHELTKKTATFKEFLRTEKDQHKLHFKIISLFTSPDNKNEDEDEDTSSEGGETAKKISRIINSDMLYDLTVKCIKKLLVLDDSFTSVHKEEFLNDSGAISVFGLWLLKEKITPFFSVLMTP